MKKNARTVSTSASALDGQIGALVRLEPEAGLPTDATGAGDMSPLEAAVLAMSHDLETLLRFAGELKRQGEALETFARALTSDMKAVKAAIAVAKSQP